MSVPSLNLNEAAPEALGSQIRQLRKAKNLTLVELALAIGKTPGFISQIERGLAKPSLKTLQALGTALGVGITWFFEGVESTGDNNLSSLVVRANKRRRIRYSPITNLEYLKFEDHLLSPNLDGHMVVGTTKFGPGGSYGDEDLTTPCNVFYYILEGSITIEYGGDNIVLHAGDCIQYNGETPHKIYNHTDKEAVAIWGQSPVRFDF